jgi:hypothetical protein
MRWSFIAQLRKAEKKEMINIDIDAVETFNHILNVLFIFIKFRTLTLMKLRTKDKLLRMT